jgi:hypothetical protein
MEALSQYLREVSDSLEHLSTPSDKILSPSLNPKPIHKPLVGKFENIWNRYPLKDGKKSAERHFKATVKTQEDWEAINRALDNYIKHLEATSWKQPKNGSTWFNNWPDWVEWNEPGIDEFKICTAKSPAPKDEKGWRHPDVKEVRNKTTGIRAQRCLYCKTIFYK